MRMKRGQLAAAGSMCRPRGGEKHRLLLQPGQAKTWPGQHPPTLARAPTWMGTKLACRLGTQEPWKGRGWIQKIPVRGQSLEQVFPLSFLL